MGKQIESIFAALAVAFLQFANIQTIQASDYYISSTLLSDCQQSIDVWEGKPGDHYAGAMCLGFINGVLTSQSLYRASSVSCRPEKIAPGAVAYALNRFVEKHPNRLGDPAAVLLEEVLDSMYECPKKAQSD